MTCAFKRLSRGGVGATVPSLTSSLATTAVPWGCGGDSPHVKIKLKYSVSGVSRERTALEFIVKEFIAKQSIPAMCWYALFLCKELNNNVSKIVAGRVI